jgi:hypothetical protein
MVSQSFSRLGAVAGIPAEEAEDQGQHGHGYEAVADPGGSRTAAAVQAVTRYGLFPAMSAQYYCRLSHDLLGPLVLTACYTQEAACSHAVVQVRSPAFKHSLGSPTIW